MEALSDHRQRQHGLAFADTIITETDPPKWRADMLDKAEEAIDRMLKNHPKSIVVHALRGSLARERDEIDHAIAAFELALSVNPNDSFALAELGRAEIDAGRTKEALIHLQEAIQLSPTDPLVYLRYFWAGMAASICRTIRRR